MAGRAVLALAGFLSLSACASLRVPDDEASRNAAADELFQVTQSRQIVAEQLENEIPYYVASFRVGYPKLTRPQVDRFRDILHDEFAANVDKIVQVNKDLYVKTFTTSELKAFSAFYRTPEGRKLVDLQLNFGKELLMIRHGMVRSIWSDAVRRFQRQEAGVEGRNTP